jgi:hypothetical protein
MDILTVKRKLRRYRIQFQVDGSLPQIIFGKKQPASPPEWRRNIMTIWRYTSVGFPAALGATIYLMYSTQFLTTGKILTQTTVSLLFFYAILNIFPSRRKEQNVPVFTIAPNLVIVDSNEATTRVYGTEIKSIGTTTDTHEQMYQGSIWIETHAGAAYTLLTFQSKYKKDITNDLPYFDRLIKEILNSKKTTETIS